MLDAAETSEADIQDDIELALIQMKSETLHKIEEALARLDETTYGYCFECGDEISERRLRALPFAVRCKDCEEAREMAEQRERQLTQRRSVGVLDRPELVRRSSPVPIAQVPPDGGSARYLVLPALRPRRHRPALLDTGREAVRPPRRKGNCHE